VTERIKRRWPWCSSASSLRTFGPDNFSTRLAEYLREEATWSRIVKGPDDIIQETRILSTKEMSVEDVDLLSERLEGDLIRLVYESNFIEYGGTIFSINESLCRIVFRGGQVRIEIPKQ
jgi:hypothetical protein